MCLYGKPFNVDLEPIKFKLIAEEGWSIEKADAIEKLYKQFLYLNVKNPEHSIVPTKDRDKFWHAHILVPYFGLRGEDDYINFTNSFELTKDMFVMAFGNYIDGNTDTAIAAMCDGDSCDGSACSMCSSPGGTCTSNIKKMFSTRLGRNDILQYIGV